MKRLVYLPLGFDKYKDNPAMFEGFEKGCRYNAVHGLIPDSIEHALSFNPDIVIYQGGLTNEQLSLFKAPVYMCTGDFRFSPMQSLVDAKAVVSKYLLPFDGEYKKVFERVLGVECKFAWEPIQDWRFKETKLMNEGDVVFIGNAYETTQSDRIELCAYMSKHCENFKAYGSVPNSMGACDVSETPSIYNNAYIAICENNFFVDSYFSQRNTGAMAAGTCPVMRGFPNIEKFFSNWNNCVYYRDKYELLNVCEFLQQNPAERNRIAANAYRNANMNYKWSNWIYLITK